MAHKTDLDEVWTLMEKIHVCMLVTQRASQLHARPMAPYARRDESAVYFLTDVRNAKDDEIEQHPDVCLAFVEGSKYLSVTGHASTSDDRAKIRELWNIAAEAWWNGPDDPNIRVLTIVPEEAEFWEGPGKIVAAVAMMAAASTGYRPDNLGENSKVRM